MTVRKSILGASLFVIPLLAGCAQAVQPAAVASAPPSATTREGAYTASIYKSAVKLPSFQVPLIPIDTTQPSVTVISLATSTPVAPSGKLSDDTWISLPADLLAHCKGKADPVLALEQILGMPPASGNWQLFQFSVSPKRIFRPCASGPSVATAECSFSLPASFPSAAARETYEATQRFVFNRCGHPMSPGCRLPAIPSPAWAGLMTGAQIRRAMSGFPNTW